MSPIEIPPKIDVADIVDFFWSEGDLSYKIDPLQKAIDDTVRRHFNHAKKICILSSRQIGKSYWVMVFAISYLLSNPNKICRVIAPTKDKCEEIVEDNLNVILNDVPAGYVARSTTKNRWNFYNGSSLRIGALERQFVDKNRGGNASLIIYEECGFVSGDDFIYGVNSVIGPQLLRSKGHEIFVSSPSEQPDHPLHTEIVPACEVLGTLFRYMVFESPSISESAIVEAAGRASTRIDQAFVSDVLKKHHSSAKIVPADVHEIARHHNVILSDDFRREYMAEVIRPASLMVIPIFHEKQTVFDFNVPAACKWIISIDWGGVRDKTAALLMAYDFIGDIALVWDEKVFDANTPTDKIMANLKQWDSEGLGATVWADVAGQLQIDLKNDYNYPVHLPQKSDWLASVNAMAARFSLNKIKIRPRCQFLIATIKAGLLNKTRTDFERSRALGHNDALAALMYGLRSLNKENPYADSGVFASDTRFVNPALSPDTSSDLASLSGKVFGGGPKRFGSFDKK